MRIKLLLIYILFSISSARSQDKNSANGGVFTPKGDLKALIVPVIFKDAPLSNPSFNNKDHYLDGWTAGNSQNLPDAVYPYTGESPFWLYNKPEHFEQYKDSSFYNDSKLFYHISKGKFRFMAEVFKDSAGLPIAIEIDPEGGRDWSHMNKKAMEEMKRLNPNFDLNSFDQRKNNPQYKFDNSVDPKPDGVVDYIIFIYRYSPSWNVQPALGMNKWTGSGGGFASPSGIMFEDYNGFKFSEGFTMMWGSGVFVHELAHTLYNLPHLWGSNGTVGEYFYRPSVGWGATSSAGLFRIPSAWETWFIGYIELLADIKSSEDLKSGNVFELRDFYTTGDAIRVEIPFSGGQKLWLEYHSTENPFDNHVWKGQRIGKDSIEGAAAGVYAYIETVSNSREKIPGVLSNVCNGIKPLSAAGNFDYEYLEENPKKNAWGNKLYKFRKLAANPISGTNPFFYFRDDFNNDGIISVDRNYNGARNEGEPIMCEEVAPDSFLNLYQCFGVFNKNWNYSRSPAFQPTDLLGMNSNPMLISYPKYNEKAATFEPVYLNGLQISFSKSDFQDRILVKIEFGKTSVSKNTRWTGYFILPDINKGDTPDLVIEKGKEILLDKSGTVNRHTKNENGEFINDTYFVIDENAKVLLKKKSKIIIEKGTTLEFRKGSEVLFSKKSKIILKKDARIILYGNEKLMTSNSIKNMGGTVIVRNN